MSYDVTSPILKQMQWEDEQLQRKDAVTQPQIRQFDTGATRDTEDGKLDFEGFLSPEVLNEFARYMHENRVQKDGSLRDSDNWQKGIPLNAYMKSLHRHFMDVWAIHRHTGYDSVTPEMRDVQQEALCAMLFNVQGYLFELLKLERG